MTKPTVFISYSHKDEQWKDRLTSQLNVLAGEGILDTWADRRIETGEDWYQEIEQGFCCCDADFCGFFELEIYQN